MIYTQHLTAQNLIRAKVTASSLAQRCCHAKRRSRKEPKEHLFSSRPLRKAGAFLVSFRAKKVAKKLTQNFQDFVFLIGLFE